MLPYDDECALNIHADIINLAERALAMARKMSTIVDVHTDTATVRGWMKHLRRPLTDINTDEQELIGLEQRGYESMARLHLALARKACRAAIKRNNITAFRLYARISEHSFLFFGTSERELQALTQ